MNAKLKDIVELQQEIDRIRSLLYKAGICADCEEEVSHDVNEPFAHCRCGTGEDTTGPSTIQKLRIELAAAKQDSARLDWIQRTAAEISIGLANFSPMARATKAATTPTRFRP